MHGDGVPGLGAMGRGARTRQRRLRAEPRASGRPSARGLASGKRSRSRRTKRRGHRPADRFRRSGTQAARAPIAAISSMNAGSDQVVIRGPKSASQIGRPASRSCRIWCRNSLVWGDRSGRGAGERLSKRIVSWVIGLFPRRRGRPHATIAVAAATTLLTALIGSAAFAQAPTPPAPPAPKRGAQGGTQSRPRRRQAAALGRPRLRRPSSRRRGASSRSSSSRPGPSSV